MNECIRNLRIFLVHMYACFLLKNLVKNGMLQIVPKLLNGMVYKVIFLLHWITNEIFAGKK